MDLIELTQNGRDINRHNYGLNEIRTEIEKPVVQRLLKLMEFRTSYPVFDGDFSIEETPENILSITWQTEVLRANAYIDLATYRVQITYFDQQENIEKSFFA